MKQTPILFSTPMVQAILEGRKTQTRRTTGLYEVNIRPSDWECYGTTTIKQINNGKVTEHFGVWFEDVNSPHRGTDAKCPYGQPGDVLWVRETWLLRDKYNRYYYKADNASPFAYWRWRPSIHMPKAAARIWLRVADVRVERLQSITQEDAKAEGVKYHPPFAVQDFFNLWRTINGLESLEANPWVWVVTFEVLSTTGNPSNI